MELIQIYECLCDRTRLRDRKSTRLNSSHLVISYAVFCLKKKKELNYSAAAAHVGRALLSDLVHRATVAAAFALLPYLFPTPWRFPLRWSSASPPSRIAGY